jgi:hypothetical protein
MPQSDAVYRGGNNLNLAFAALANDCYFTEEIFCSALIFFFWLDGLQ